MDNSASRKDIVFWLDAATDSPALGGKARLLVRLMAAGLPVPPGFVLSADALPVEPPPGLGQPLPEDIVLPDEAALALAAAYAELGRRLGEANPLVAVRSSGLAEDLEQASFAGQYVTVLGVRGQEEVLSAAGRCWASLWTPGVAAYRAAVERRTGEPLPSPGMAVLVQALIEAEAAGVAETVDPLSGSPEAVVIHAAWGLGRSVVDGSVEPDTWRVARESLAVIELRTGNKLTKAGLGLAPERQPVAEPLRRRPCLTLEQAAEVAALALKAEAVVGGPADVEWALADGRVWLLQARPLVRHVAAAEAAMPAPPGPSGPTPIFPFTWPDADAAKYHWRREADDARIFAALQPFELDVRALNYRSSIEAMELTGGQETMRCLEVNGYLYCTHMPYPGSEEERALRAEAYLRPIRALHERGDTLLGTVIEPEAQANTRRLAAVDPDALAPADLAAHLEDTLRWYERAWILHSLDSMMMDPWDETSPAGRAPRLYREVTGDENPWALYACFAYLPQKEHLAVDGLIELARMVKESPALGALFRGGEPSQILDGLQAVEGGPAFRRRLEVLLDDFGLLCGASGGVMRGQVMPGWREDPTLVIAIVQRYLPQNLGALVETRRRSSEQYKRDVETLRGKLAEAGATPEQRAQFDFWFQALLRQITGLWDHNYYLDSPMNALLHRALLACGRRLAAAGAIEEAADAWWLRAQQVAAAVRSLDAPNPPAWGQLVVAQKALYSWQRSLIPPAYLGAPPPAQPATPAGGADEQLPANLLVKGQGAAPGVATGRVRLVDHRLLVPEVQPGDVFVAHDCGVLWVTLLPIAAAVVLDGSNPGEHPTRICYEFGVPCVVRTGNATQVLREGQRVTVDGNKGWVLAAEEG